MGEGYSDSRARAVIVGCNNCGETGLVPVSQFEEKVEPVIPCMHCGDGRMYAPQASTIEETTIFIDQVRKN